MRGLASWKTSIIAAFIAHVRPSQERVPLMLSGDGGPLPATEAAYMDQSMRRAWASAALRKCSSQAAYSSCRLYPFARQAAHVRCRSDSCSAKSPSSPFGPRTKDLSSLAPRVFAVPGLDARAKKRKSGFDLCFSFRNVPRQHCWRGARRSS